MEQALANHHQSADDGNQVISQYYAFEIALWAFVLGLMVGGGSREGFLFVAGAAVIRAYLSRFDPNHRR